MINLALAKERNLSQEDILSIERLHSFRDTLHNSLELLVATNQRELMYEVGQLLFKLEASLQSLWKFPVDARYYKYWDVPFCICGKMDCEDAYPTGYYVVNHECWLHKKKEN